MKKEDTISLLKKLYSNQLTVEEGCQLIISYIFDQKGQLIDSIQLSFTDGDKYQYILNFIFEYYEKKFSIMKIFNIKNQLIDIC